MATGLVILDRDGTIIVDKVYNSDPRDIEFLPSVLDGLKLLIEADLKLAIATNQSGIGRGYFKEKDFFEFQICLESELARLGITIAKTYHCPHAPFESCRCRKPAPGMIRAAMDDLDFPAHKVAIIGDSDADMGAALAAGILGARVASAATDCKSSFIEAARLVVRAIGRGPER